MKRLKNLWDAFHPELNHFNEEYLRQQATYIQQKYHFPKTQTVANNNAESQIVGNTPVRQDKVEDTTNDIDKKLNTSLQVQNRLQNEQIINKKLSETLRNMLAINYMKYKSLTEMEQTEVNNARKKPSNEELDVIDIIACKFSNNIKNEMCM